MIQGFGDNLLEMGARFSFGQFEAGAAADHFNAVFDPRRDHVLDIHRARHALSRASHVAAECHLHIGEL